MFDAGVDTLGMHLEAVTPEVRARIMPGKATVPLGKYFPSFDAAVRVFGRGQVSTYILAGLGDTAEAILDMSKSWWRWGSILLSCPLSRSRARPWKVIRRRLPPLWRRSCGPCGG
jgi:biotin synthase-related radical SAM superfamily protein